jgi:hypothetical protein
MSDACSPSTTALVALSAVSLYSTFVCDLTFSMYFELFGVSIF